MTELRVQRDGGDPAPLRTPLELSEHLHAATAVVIVVRGPGQHARATTGSGRSGWRVDVMDGPVGVRAEVPNTDAVYDLFRSWCNGDGWWAEAFDWRPCH